MGKKKSPKILVVTSCTGKKRHKTDGQLVQRDFTRPRELAVRSEGLAQYRCRAEEMYTGEQHRRLTAGLEVLRRAGVRSSLWIVSAGYGLIAGERMIVPYECTFDSMKSGEIDEWASFLKIPATFRSVLSDCDLGFVLLGQKYLRALQIEKREVFPVPLIFFCSSERELKGAKGAFYAAGVREARDFRCGVVGLKGEIFRSLADEMAADPKILPGLVKKPQLVSVVLDKVRKRLTSRVSSPGAGTPPKAGKVVSAPAGYSACENCPSELRKGEPGEYLPPQRVTIRYTPRETPGMLYFIPEWDDRVDPRYDFVHDYHHSELFGVRHDSYRDDCYAHELMGRYNCDGMLVSKVTIEKSAKKKTLIESIGIHAYLRCPKNVPVMGDCGAFGYIDLHEPPYATDEIVEYYQRLGFDYGVIIDHLIVTGACRKTTCWLQQKNGEYAEISAEKFAELAKSDEYRVVKTPTSGRNLSDSRPRICEKKEFDFAEAGRRWQLTLDNGRDFMEIYRSGKYTFRPMASCQGWDADSYTRMFREFQDMGYEYIALGGLVRSPSALILEILTSIARIRKPATKIHLFGIGRLDVVKEFMALGVHSCDSASQLRVAWIGADKNYWATPEEKYSAIRIPPVRGQSSRIKKMLRAGRGTLAEFERLGNAARQSLLAFDRGVVSLDRALDSIMQYDRLVGDRRERHEVLYRQVLEAAPWRHCPCPLCREHGVEIVLFRGNNRNRRRGFHNTYVFFEEFKRLTGRGQA